MRILDAGKYEAAQRLQQGCAALTNKVEQLNGLVLTYLEILGKQVCLGPFSCSFYAFRSMLAACFLTAIDCLAGTKD